MYVSIESAKNLRSAIKIVLLLEMCSLIISFLYTNQLPIIDDLIADQSNPQGVNSNIIWIAQAYDKDNDQIFYKFLLDGPSTREAWQEVTSWQGNNSWTWCPSSDDIGKNQIKVLVRDENHAGPDGYDVEKTASFTIFELLPVVRDLRPSSTSLLAAGSDITWTANAYDPAGRKIYYKFSIRGSSTNGRKISMTDWTTKSSWTWKTKPSDAGDYRVYVEITGDNDFEPEADRDASFTLVNPPTPPASTQQPERADLKTQEEAERVTSFSPANAPTSSPASTQQPERTSLNTQEETPATSAGTSISTSKRERSQGVIQIGRGTEWYNNPVILGERDSPKMVYIGQGSIS